MIKVIILFSFFFSGSLNAFMEKPWISEPYSSEFFLSYAFQHYPSIANEVGVKTSSNDNFLVSDISFAFMDYWDLEAEIEFDETTAKNFGFESFGIQARKMLLNDLAGDLLTFSIGNNIRIVPHGRLIDPSTPYHNVFNIELNFSLGKEWNDYFDWFYRTWLLVGLGQANKGYPWIRFNYHFQGKVRDVWEWETFAIGYFGTAGKHAIDLKTFMGYYNIGHQSIDLGLGGSYLLGIWGKISLNGAYRVYAKAYPQNAITLTLSYTLPFSFL
jgi:hypothetical protein